MRKVGLFAVALTAAVVAACAEKNSPVVKTFDYAAGTSCWQQREVALGMLVPWVEQESGRAGLQEAVRLPLSVLRKSYATGTADSIQASIARLAVFATIVPPMMDIVKAQGKEIKEADLLKNPTMEALSSFAATFISTSGEYGFDYAVMRATVAGVPCDVSN